MRVRSFVAIFFALILGLGWSSAWADDDDDQFPEGVSFKTLIKTQLAIEGLTGDRTGNLYTTGRVNPCPVWRINLLKPSLVVVGNINVAGCSPSGIAFNKAGKLFVADGDKVFAFTPNSVKPPNADVYATGVPGTNGIAFDEDGNLWTGDGTTGQGRVWKVAPCKTFPKTPCAGVEVFRIQPMRNGTDLGGDVAAQTGVTSQGVGRQNRTFPPGTLTITIPVGTTLPATVTPAGGQDLVANGVAFDKNGNLLIADTARGAIWKVEFDWNGNLRSETGCDSTFTANTLCLNNILITHPLVEGTDGIALDYEGNIWNSANERNAIVVVSGRRVKEIFRNSPDGITLLRNTGPLETPTSPFLLGTFFCTANSDGNRRDNSPATAGEIGGTGQPKGKISCMVDPVTGNLIQLKIPGLPLPVY